MKAQVASRPAWPGWLVWLAALAMGLASYYYFTGETSTLPLRTVPHLRPLVLTLDSVAAGPVYLPVQASGFITTLTHDVAGPYTQPVAAALFLLLLVGALVGWVAGEHAGACTFCGRHGAGDIPAAVAQYRVAGLVWY